MVNIPRPVLALRIWNSLEQKYDEIPALMDGAPTQSECESYWLSFLDELRFVLEPKYGEGFINDCIYLDIEDIKEVVPEELS